MRFIRKTVLVASFMMTFFTLLVVITFKFQFLDPNFWINTFREGAVYQSLETSIGEGVVDSFVKEGAPPQEASEIASVFTSRTIQDIVEKNTVNVLKYVNSETREIIIYFPLDKLPGDIRDSLEINSSEISLDYLLKTFGNGSAPIGSDFFTQMRSFKHNIDVTLVLTLLTLLSTIFFLYKIEERGRRLVTTWISVAFSGALTLLFVALANIWVASTQVNLTQSGQIGQKVLAKLLPPVASEVFYLWTIVAIVTTLVGLLSLLITKKGLGTNIKIGLKSPQTPQ